MLCAGERRGPKRADPGGGGSFAQKHTHGRGRRVAGSTSGGDFPSPRSGMFSLPRPTFPPPCMNGEFTVRSRFSAPSTSVSAHPELFVLLFALKQPVPGACRWIDSLRTRLCYQAPPRKPPAQFILFIFFNLSAFPTYSVLCLSFTLPCHFSSSL